MVRLFAATLVLCAASACSKQEPRPERIGDCYDPQGGCLPATGASGGGYAPPADGGTDAGACGSLVFQSLDCRDCAEAFCCTFAGECADGGDCSALDQCLTASCASFCAGDDGGKSCGQIAFQSIACEGCVESSCCAEDTTCSADPDCLLYAQCIQTCAAGDKACLDDCQVQDPTGFQKYAPLLGCAQTACASQCR